MTAVVGQSAHLLKEWLLPVFQATTVYFLSPWLKRFIKQYLSENQQLTHQYNGGCCEVTELPAMDAN